MFLYMTKKYDYSIAETLAKQRQFFLNGKSLQFHFRIQQLRRLEKMLRENDRLIVSSLGRDLGKPVTEAYVSEIAPVLAEIRTARKNLRQWMCPEHASQAFMNLPSSGYSYPMPLGIALIIGPWNYPFGLVFTPVVNALAAGNCIVLKPSEYAPQTSKVLYNLVARYFDPEIVTCFEGDANVAKKLIDDRPDIVLFTGGTETGKRVMEACAKHPIPVILELGGCNPCIVDEDVDIDVAAKRIVWGKFFNAGQTCIAPNMCYVHEKIYTSFIDRMRSAIMHFYGSDPQQSSDYGRIVNRTHFERLNRLLRIGGVIVVGGETDADTRYIAPTIIECRDGCAGYEEDEIFGPLLPVFSYFNIEALLEQLQNRPSSLMTFSFSRNEKHIAQVRRSVHSGSISINAIQHMFASTSLPFGGVGPSGMGRYHGKAGFDSFSYRRSEFHKPFHPDAVFAYPPYKTPLWLLKRAVGVLFR